MENTTLETSLQPSHRNDLLKILALITMLVDHVGYLFFPGQMLLRTIGRIAFPIFAYQVAIGYQKTSNLKKYAFRLFLFALLSQVPYFWFNPNLAFEFYDLNIMFTLLISLGVIYAFDHGRQRFKAFTISKRASDLLAVLGYCALFLLILILPEYSMFRFEVGIEYGIYGLLLVLLFYVYGNQVIPLLIGYVLLSLFNAYYRAATRYYYEVSKPFIDCFTSFSQIWEIQIKYNKSYETLSGIFFQSRSIMAVAFIWFFNWFEKLGKVDIHLNKYVGYFFYPVHITLLLIIKYYLMHS